jgi:short-subunit dehydrogenase
MKTSTKNRTALITGASSGIGYAIANELAARGYNLILASNEETKLNEVCEEFTTKHGINAWAVFMDLAEPGAAIKLYDWCQKAQQQVDILVNNAGFFFFGEVVESDVDQAQRMLTLHTSTPAMLCTLFGRNMKKRRSGNILNISSLAAFLPYPGIAFYSSTKRFLKNFSRSLRTEMIDYNVNVTCICPGSVSTQLYEINDAKRKKAMKTGVMMRADRLARLSVNAMFSRKSILIPGFLTNIFLLISYVIPHGIILRIRRYSNLLPPEKQ